MEQARRKRAHLERVLLVCGAPNAGKSKLLRQMFSDPRFGTKSVIPANKVGTLPLSNARCLYFRLSSPHEKEETLPGYLRKLDRATERAWWLYWRINFACAIQPNATRKTPDAVVICRSIIHNFVPERIRLIQLNPRQDNESGDVLLDRQVDALWRLGVEVMTIDARRAGLQSNGLMLSDFFDFS